MSNKLYERVNDGDQRTVVKHLNNGEKIRTVEGVIILKANVKVKATETYQWSTGGWSLTNYMLDTMVEVESARDDRPPPTSMPTPSDVFEDLQRGEVKLPEARDLGRSLFERIFGLRK